MGNGMYDNVTLVIPTYDRPWCLLRVLDYYKRYAPGIRIIVADSGPDEARESHRRIVASFSNLNILYLGDYAYNTMIFMKLPDSVYCCLGSKTQNFIFFSKPIWTQSIYSRQHIMTDIGTKDQLSLDSFYDDLKTNFKRNVDMAMEKSGDDNG